MSSSDPVAGEPAASKAFSSQPVEEHHARNWRELCPQFLRPVAKELRRQARIVRSELVPSARSERFAEIHRGGGWEPDQPRVSGAGSDLAQTALIRAALPPLLADLGVRSILDAPCGDFYWMRECRLDVDRYIGMDIVPALVEENLRKYAAPGRQFMVGDVVASPLPQVDLIFCRDCLVHLRARAARTAIKNFQRSGSTFLLTTTFPARKFNDNVDQTGDWRPINLMLPPYALPPPLRVLNEGCTEENGRWADKSLGLWRLADLSL